MATARRTVADRKSSRKTIRSKTCQLKVRRDAPPRLSPFNKLNGDPPTIENSNESGALQMMCCSPVDSRITAVGITDERNTFFCSPNKPSDRLHTHCRSEVVGGLVNILPVRERTRRHRYHSWSASIYYTACRRLSNDGLIAVDATRDRNTLTGTMINGMRHTELTRE